MRRVDATGIVLSSFLVFALAFTLCICGIDTATAVVNWYQVEGLDAGCVTRHLKPATNQHTKTGQLEMY